MTREEVIKFGKRVLSLSLFDETHEFCEIAVKALEQEPILDKIREEIMDFEEELFHRPNTDYTDYAAVRHCVDIIDKYKASPTGAEGSKE